MDLVYRFDPYQPLIAKRPADFETALATLVDGNQRLVDLVAQMQRSFMDGSASGEAMIIPRDFFSLGLPLFTEEALDQAPFAMVLGCSDARVPVESIFDQNFNDLFVVRMAGNVLGVDGIGSFQYALRNPGRHDQDHRRARAHHLWRRDRSGRRLPAARRAFRDRVLALAPIAG